MKIKDPFIRMVAYAFLGAFAGLIGGFVLGWVIYGIGYLMFDDSFRENMYYGAPFLGMACGSFIGGVMGAIVAIKNK